MTSSMLHVVHALIVLLTFILQVRSELVDLTLSKTEVIAPNPVTFTCTDDTPSPHFILMKNRKEIVGVNTLGIQKQQTEGSSFQVQPNVVRKHTTRTVVFTLPQAFPKNSGLYSCKTASRTSNYALLKVGVPPSAMKVKIDLDNRRKGFISVSCTFTMGLPYGSFSMRIDNITQDISLMTAQNTTSKKSIYTTSVHLISNSKKAVQCTARNYYGFTSDKKTIDNKFSPSINYISLNGNFQEKINISEDKKTLTCEATGNPKPTVRWKSISLDLSQYNSTNILPVNILWNFGLFKLICEAKNSMSVSPVNKTFYIRLFGTNSAGNRSALGQNNDRNPNLSTAATVPIIIIFFICGVLFGLLINKIVTKKDKIKSCLQIRPRRIKNKTDGNTIYDCTTYDTQNKMQKDPIYENPVPRNDFPASSDYEEVKDSMLSRAHCLSNTDYADVESPASTSHSDNYLKLR